MASQQRTADFFAEQMAEAGTITTRKMFGEYALYCDGKVIAFICDDQLFIKPTEKGRAFIGECNEQPAYPGSKLYFLISDERWDDSEWLSELAQITASEVPLPKKKKSKTLV